MAKNPIQIPESFKGEIDNSETTLDKYSEDTSLFRLKPELVVYPKDVTDIATLIHYVHTRRGELSLTARSAGTDMSGGPLTTSIVVDFLRHFNQIKYVDTKRAVTDPGVFYRDFDKATLEFGSILPSFTASRELNTVGGMVANNSAGELSLTYGKTDRYVKNLKVVLQDGIEYEFRELNRAELESKKAQDNYEGEVYRRMEGLIRNYHEVIMANKPNVSKNSAGYAVWDIWNPERDTFDLTKLFVGSQGTLGLITEITFDLVPQKTESRLLVLFLRPKHFEKIGEIVNEVLKFKPQSFESYDDKTFQILLKVFPKLFKRLGGNPFTITKNFWPEIKMVLKGGIPKLVLMAEFTADTEEEAERMAKDAAGTARTFGFYSHITKNQEEAEKYWVIRRESFNLLRQNVKHLHTAPFIDDFVVRPEDMPTFIPKLYEILDDYKIIYTVAGHVGDGNFHIIPLMDFSKPDFVDTINEISERVYNLIAEYKGSITGEHNDGLIRTPFLYKMFSNEMLDIFSEVKEIFDPHRIFNPHKKVDPSPELLRTAVKKGTK